MAWLMADALFELKGEADQLRALAGATARLAAASASGREEAQRVRELVRDVRSALAAAGGEAGAEVGMLPLTAAISRQSIGPFWSSVWTETDRKRGFSLFGVLSLCGQDPNFLAVAL